MTFATLGDMSQLFATRRQNVDLKARMHRLTNELSSGQVSDLAAHLGRDTARLTELDRTLELSRAHAASARATGSMLNTMQVALDRLSPLQTNLADQLSLVPLSGTAADVQKAGVAAEAAFADAVSALNAQYGGMSLFAGRATDGAALASSRTMLADLKLATAGATDAATLQGLVDTWFDTPGGGFETVGYLGDAAGHWSRKIDDAETATIGVRADDPAFRDMMKGIALAALAADPASSLSLSEQHTAMGDASVRLRTSSAGTVASQASLGLTEGRIEEAIARHGARQTSLGILRNEMASADPYTTASAIQEVETLLETHYLVTARLSGLSLAKYLR